LVASPDKNKGTPDEKRPHDRLDPPARRVADLLDRQLEAGRGEDLRRPGSRNEEPGFGGKRVPTRPRADEPAADSDPEGHRAPHRFPGKRSACLCDGAGTPDAGRKRTFRRESGTDREGDTSAVTNPIYLALDLPQLDAARALAEKVKAHVGGL